ncbi:MAG: class I SAM-dependent methyltransferase [Bacteroidota bacterium]
MQTKASDKEIQSANMLKARMSANNKALKDFDEWCFQQIPEISLHGKVLDLGCGNGKQLHLFSRIFSDKSTFFGLDLSNDSLQDLRSSYQSPPELQLVEGSFDMLDSLKELEGFSFDLIYAAYALYYTKDLKKLIKDVYDLLKPGGIFWVIGPDSGTNQEFLNIIRPLHEVEDFMDYVFDRFMPEVVELGTQQGFNSIKPSMLRNKVFFPSADAFMAYLSNSLFYRPGYDEEIKGQVQAVIDREGVFAVSKHIMSIQLRK